MKKTVLLLFLILSAFYSVKGQSTYFAPIGAQWYYSYHESGPPNSSYLHIIARADTIIMGKSCRILSTQHYRWDNQILQLPDRYVYYENDIVYHYNQAYSKFTPLYYFGANSGDTLKFYNPVVVSNPADSIWKAVVDSVTTFVLGPVSFEQYWVHTVSGNFKFWNNNYLDLIGGTYLLEHLPMTLATGAEGDIRCYLDPVRGQVLHFNDEDDCDYRANPNSLYERQALQFAIYPNPAKEELYIKTDQKVMNSYSYRIIDMRGRQLQAGNQIDNGIIPLKSLPPGNYILAISNQLKNGRQLFTIAE